MRIRSRKQWVRKFFSKSAPLSIERTDDGNERMIRAAFERYAISGAICLAVVIGASSAYLLQTSGYGQPDETVLPPAGASQAVQPPDFVVGPGDIASSPQPDTPVKSMFEFNENGDLLVNQNTELALDSLLARLPSEPTAEDVKTTEAAARSGLPEKAANKAAELFREYATYRKAISALPGQPEPDDPIEERDAYDNKVAHLRSRHFDIRTSEALFGVREAQRIYSAQVLRVASNGALSTAEKEQQIKALHQALPPKVAELEFNGAEFSAEIEVQVATVRLRHGSDEDVKNLRRQYFGVEMPAADRTAAEK